MAQELSLKGTPFKQELIPESGSINEDLIHFLGRWITDPLSFGQSRKNRRLDAKLKNAAGALLNNIASGNYKVDDPSLISLANKYVENADTREIDKFLKNSSLSPTDEAYFSDLETGEITSDWDMLQNPEVMLHSEKEGQSSPFTQLMRQHRNEQKQRQLGFEGGGFIWNRGDYGKTYK